MIKIHAASSSLKRHQKAVMESLNNVRSMFLEKESAENYLISRNYKFLQIL